MEKIKNWSALHFLASLGAGGMVVTFFMYFLFWVPHPDKPIPVYSDWFSHIQTASSGKQGMIILGLAGILGFGWLHFKWLLLNFNQYRQFKVNGGFEKIIGTNAHTQRHGDAIDLRYEYQRMLYDCCHFCPRSMGSH